MTDSDTATLRERQKGLTRDAILEALAHTILEKGLYDFSVQDVADRAGVSHRTVYRHFPGRDALLDGLAREMDRFFDEREQPTLPESALDIAAKVRSTFELFGERSDLVRAVAIGALATGTQPDSRRTRDRIFREKVMEAARGLPEEEARGASAVIRYLANSLAWVVLTDQLGLDEEEAGDAVAWAVETLITNLERRAQRARDAEATCDHPTRSAEEER